jgi:bacteriorhodopsin
MASYSDLANIQASTDFTKRATMAIASYAHYILGQSQTAPVNLKKLNWAAATAENPSVVLEQIAHYVILDATFTALPAATADSSSLTDAQFDSVIQTAINSTLLSW